MLRGDEFAAFQAWPWWCRLAGEHYESEMAGIRLSTLLALQPATIGPNATLHWRHRAFCGCPNTFTLGQRNRASSVGVRRSLDFLGHHSCALGAARSTCGDFEEAHRDNALNFKAELDVSAPSPKSQRVRRVDSIDEVRSLMEADSIVPRPERSSVSRFQRM